jgi:trehalose 6-phosphate phosphatase
MTMKPLAAAWPGLARRIARARSIVVASDFDGTLAPIRNRPEAATPAPGARAALARLAAVPGVTMAIVSGRALEDLERRVGVDGPIWIGNQGYETRIPGRPVVRAWEGVDRAPVLRAARAVSERLKGVRGVFLEDKGPIVTLHYRLAPRKEIDRIGEALRNMKRQQASAVRIAEGKCVFEFRPARPVNKGRALLRALSEINVPARAMFWYFGDDEADEEAFAALPDDAVTVHVGSLADASVARYVVDAPRDVVSVLDAIRRVAERRPAAARFTAKPPGC